MGDLFPSSCPFPPQELVAEKERNGLLTAKMRERINALEKEHGTFQSKIHVSYQESQQMKIKVNALPKLHKLMLMHKQMGAEKSPQNCVAASWF